MKDERKYAIISVQICEGFTMTDGFSGTDTLRDRLLIAGTKELGQYGMAEFSLRRVAAACGTSCAAPYKHFKNKEAFILEIIRYIDRQWEIGRASCRERV